jgi:hypothetical protein
MRCLLLMKVAALHTSTWNKQKHELLAGLQAFRNGLTTLNVHVSKVVTIATEHLLLICGIFHMMKYQRRMK